MIPITFEYELGSTRISRSAETPEAASEVAANRFKRGLQKREFEKWWPGFIKNLLSMFSVTRSNHRRATSVSARIETIRAGAKMLLTVCRSDFRRACPGGITTGRLQRTQRIGPLSFGLAPMEATTGQLSYVPNVPIESPKWYTASAACTYARMLKSQRNVRSSRSAPAGEQSSRRFHPGKPDGELPSTD